MQPARRSYVGNFESAEDPWSTLVEFFHDLTTTADQPLVAAPVIEPPLELHLTEDEPAVIEPPVQPVIAAAAPAPLPKPAAQPAAAAAPQRLSDYVNLMPLKARCPRHPEVELAMDDTGTIHLLMQANADDVDGALRTLDETRRWTMEHRELIALTVPQRTASGGEPVTHLFTDEPKRAADFALASPAAQRRMKLHLLKPVIVSGLSVNVHAEIL
jgi:hypothetical protein